MNNNLNKIYFKHYSDGSGCFVGITGNDYFNYDMVTHEIMDSDYDEKWAHFDFDDGWKEEIINRYIKNILPSELFKIGKSIDDVSEYISDYDEKHLPDQFEIYSKIKSLSGTEFICTLDEFYQNKIRAALKIIIPEICDNYDIEEIMSGRLCDLEDNLNWREALFDGDIYKDVPYFKNINDEIKEER